VIRTLNEDRPFDHFLVQQLAGDLLPYASDRERHDNIVATSFLVLGNHNLEDQDKEKLRMDAVDEQLDVIGRGILAQTIGCARCHDHKFDPIPTRDYYAMAGILRNTQSFKHANVSEWLETPLPADARFRHAQAEHQQEVAALRSEIEQRELMTGSGGEDSADEAVAQRKANLDQLRKRL
ncbi:MAG: DUF1549 domain-containing protein, partial [Planctomycetaceae bacterium]|nr:DUF1549 domain-containing protein [Planctomycetaceae bacterium]